MAPFVPSLRSLWCGFCTTDKSERFESVGRKKQGEIWQKMVTFVFLCWVVYNKRRSMFCIRLLYFTIFHSLLSLYTITLFWCGADGYPKLCFLASFHFSCLLKRQFDIKQELKWVRFNEMKFHKMFSFLFLQTNVPCNVQSEQLLFLKLHES